MSLLLLLLQKNSKLSSFSLKMLVKSAQNRSLSSEICPENSYIINHFSAKFALGKVLLIWQGGGGRRDEDIETWSLKFWQPPLLAAQFFRTPPSCWFWSIKSFEAPPPLSISSSPLLVILKELSLSSEKHFKIRKSNASSSSSSSSSLFKHGKIH